MDLAKKKCKPCEDNKTKPLTDEEVRGYLDEVPQWKLSDQKSIYREYIFKDFLEAIQFVDQVADIAEEEGHHPDIHIFYNKVYLK